MVFQGSKNKLAKYLVPIIQKYIEENDIKVYVEPMMGGCNLIDKITCERKVGNDVNENLVALLKAVRKDNNISFAPDSCSFEHYSEVRADKEHKKYPIEYYALIGYCASYGGRFFDGGYGRDSKGGRSTYNERLNNLRQQAPNLNGIEMVSGDYKKVPIMKDALYYFDPPYKGTKKYGKQQFDYDEFYGYLRELAKTNIVLVSEYNMPDDFICIWEKERKVLQKSDRVTGDKAVEKLYTL